MLARRDRARADTLEQVECCRYRNGIVAGKVNPAKKKLEGNCAHYSERDRLPRAPLVAVKDTLKVSNHDHHMWSSLSEHWKMQRSGEWLRKCSNFAVPNYESSVVE